MKKTDYSKLRTKILGIIEGLTLSDERYFNVRRAITICEGIHCNTRKDGSPEFSHQLEMLSIGLSLHKSLLQPYEVYMGILLHDTIEDYPEHTEELHQVFPDIVQYSRKLSKFKDLSQDEVSYYSYFEQVSNCSVCSIIKLIDRIHNLSTAPGVFSTAKITEYCSEVDKYFWDMLRNAKSQFNQREAYEVLKVMLQIQVRTIRTFVELLSSQEEEMKKVKTPQEVMTFIGFKHTDD